MDVVRWVRFTRKWIVAALSVGLVAASGPIQAHDVPASVAMIDIGRATLDVELQIPLSELGAALSLPLADNPSSAVGQYETQIGAYLREHLRLSSPGGTSFALQSQSLTLRHTDNANWSSNDWLVTRSRFEVPPQASSERFDIDDTVIVHRVLSHKSLVYVRRDVRNGLTGDQPLAIGLLGYGQTHLRVDGSGGSWWKGFTRLFQLGMRHIAEGPDHVLFLLTLLLTAPLLAGRDSAGHTRWLGRKPMSAAVRSIAAIVSGFTLAHSLTLLLGARGWLAMPTRMVESLIAFSILITSLHAWRPILAGREAWIASGFGLIHGLAFAETLTGLGFDHWSLAVSVLGFNLGIECMQLLIILAVLPLLLALSASRYYQPVRLIGAAIAGACAVTWIGERALRLPNPLAPVMNWMTAPPAWVIGVVCPASLICMAVLLGKSLSAAVVRSEVPRDAAG
jgi:hypothetical protein